jgi:probable O-glycosylation ligase (exosortase A-associated)
VSIRDVVVTAVILGLLPFCLAQPWIGILTWSWVGYMNPHRLTWGFAYHLPFALVIMAATLAGLPFTKDKKGLPGSIEVFLLLALWGWFFVTTMFAFYPAEAWTHFVKISKILLGVFLTLILFQDARRLQMLIWVIVGSIGFYGFKGGLFTLATGAQHQILGPPESFLAGNTEIGLALNMVIPLLVYLQRQEQHLWRRRALMAVTILSIISSLSTYSRGALLGLAVVVPLLFLKSRARLILLPLLIIGVILLPSVMPEGWVQRMETIETYHEDMSANQRLNSWFVSYQLAKDYPIMGGGFRTFSAEIYNLYMPGYVWARAEHDAHSIYFQVLGEHGFTGLGIFVALLLSTLVSLRRLIWQTRKIAEQQWICNCAQMVEVSLIAYIVSGTFLSMSYFDLFYHLVAITVILKTLAKAPKVGADMAPATTVSPDSPTLVKA